MTLPKNNFPVLLALYLGIPFLSVFQTLVFADEQPSQFRAVLLSRKQVSSNRLKSLKGEGYHAVVLELKSRDLKEASREIEAAKSIQKSGMRLDYWLEIGRNPELADRHPEWMASLQGHQEWRRFHKKFPQPGPEEVVKNYPWVPIFYQEAFEAHLVRVRKILAGKPLPTALFLNDLQGAPSACGCGNPLCRWTADYGPIRTATRLGDDAAARFVTAVKKIVPAAKIIPVWTTECEEHDGSKDGLCAGVGCFRGICWKAYTRQLMPLAEQSPQIAALLPFKQFQRDLSIYGPKAGWISHALSTFEKMPPMNGGKAIPSSRLLAVLQGWDVSKDEQKAQIERQTRAGTGGYIMALVRIEQSWQPKIFKRNTP